MGADCAFTSPRSSGGGSDHRRERLAIACGLVLLLGAPVLRAEQAQSDRDASIDAALLSHGIGHGNVRAELIAGWNSLAHDIAFAEDQFLTFKGQRALAMMHLAMHDALNTIVPVYERYVLTEEPRLASPVAAAAQAAHDVLLAQYPMRQTALDGELARWLAPVEQGVLRDRGVELGHAAAAAILAVREADDWDVPGTYAFGEGPGRYQTTPPWNGFVAQPGFRFAKPFVLEYPHKFRPSPPPSLRTGAYARAFREVKEYGAADSARRTADQTVYAIWWMEFAEGSVNRLARQLSTNRRMHLWPTARAFAHLGMALYDTYVATWDARVRVRPLASVHRHSRSRRGREPAHDFRRELGIAASGATLSRVFVGTRGGLRRLVERALGHVRTPRVVHDADNDRSSGDAHPVVREFSRGGCRVRRLPRAARMALPLCDRRRPRAWTADRPLYDPPRAERAPAKRSVALIGRYHGACSPPSCTGMTRFAPPTR